MNDVLISFIIPVYNSEKYLANCLSSIINQNNQAIEIICVNDGSTDTSGEILKDFQENYPFVKVFTQKNQGITGARNTALQHAVGKWLCFVDNDDIIAENAVEVISRHVDENSDIIYFDFKPFSGDEPEQNKILSAYESCQYTKADIQKMQSDCINRFKNNQPLMSYRVLTTPWAKIYRREFLKAHQLSFRKEVKHEEDVLFNFEALAYCCHAKRINFTLYYYRLSIYSESHRYRQNIFQDVLVTLAAYQAIIRQNYSDRRDIAELYSYRVLWELLYCVALGNIHIHNPASYKERKKQFQQLFTEYPAFADIFSTVKTTRFGFKQSVLATLIKYRQFWLLNLLGKLSK